MFYIYVSNPLCPQLVEVTDSEIRYFNWAGLVYDAELLNEEDVADMVEDGMLIPLSETMTDIAEAAVNWHEPHDVQAAIKWHLHEVEALLRFLKEA